MLPMARVSLSCMSSGPRSLLIWADFVATSLRGHPQWCQGLGERGVVVPVLVICVHVLYMRVLLWGLIPCEECVCALHEFSVGWLLVRMFLLYLRLLVRVDYLWFFVHVMYLSVLVRVGHLWGLYLCFTWVFLWGLITCEDVFCFTWDYLWGLITCEYVFCFTWDYLWGLITCDFLYMCCTWVYLWGLVTCDKFLLAHFSKPVLELYLWRYMFDTAWWLVFTMGGQQFELSSLGESLRCTLSSICDVRAFNLAKPWISATFVLSTLWTTILHPSETNHSPVASSKYMIRNTKHFQSIPSRCMIRKQTLLTSLKWMHA